MVKGTPDLGLVGQSTGDLGPGTDFEVGVIL